jgi:hypothetical protein
MSDDVTKSKSGERNHAGEPCCVNTYTRNDRARAGFLPSLFWSLAFIILGSLLYAHSQGWLAEDRWFPYFLIAMGVVFVAEVLILYLRPNRAYFSFGRLITGAVLIFIGFALVIGFVHWLPLVLIIVGIAIAAGFYTRRNHSAYK